MSKKQAIRRTKQGFSIIISLHQGEIKLPPQTRIKFWVTHCLRHFVKTAEVHLDFVNAKTMRQLNKQYRKKDYPTNVLAFPLHLPLQDKKNLLGNVIICPEIVAQEALAQDKNFQEHLAHLLIHGCLHLLGYDHKKRLEAKTMEALEVKLLAELGMRSEE